MKLGLALLLLAAPVRAKPLLKVLTYNVAGIPIVHARWPERRKAIGQKLRADGYDIIAMQETWRDKDALELAEASGLPYYTRYGRSISMGTGLAILSRYPILEKHERPFTCRPSALRWLTGESIANKGVLMARVATPQGPLDVYTAHPVADYPDAKFRTLRFSQLYELAEMVTELSAGRPFLIMGDLNTFAGEPGYQLLLDLLGLEDACVKKGRDVCGITNDAEHARIDHILVPRGKDPIVAAKTAFTGTLPGTDVAYSDHLAVEGELEGGILKRRLSPEPEKRAAALKTIRDRIDKMTDAMFARQQARAWLPVYGFLMSARYEHQRRQLSAISARAESDRIRLLHLK